MAVCLTCDLLVTCDACAEQHYQLQRAVQLLCKKGSLTRAAVAPTLSRILQHTAGATPAPLLVVAMELVQVKEGRGWWW